MKQIAIGVFAHPDDESFGPGGTFIKLARSGVETHIITATRGEIGGDLPAIAKIREAEATAAAELLELTSHRFLDFVDGELCNSKYKELVKAVTKHIRVITRREEDVVLTLITFENRGVSGHLDHIAMSMVTSYVYVHAAELLPDVKTIRLKYFCLSKAIRPKFKKDYFVYAPAGYSDEEIDEVNDVSSVVDQKIAAIRAHASQNPENILARGTESLSYEHFLHFKD